MGYLKLIGRNWQLECHHAESLKCGEGTEDVPIPNVYVIAGLGHSRECLCPFLLSHDGTQLSRFVNGLRIQNTHIRIFNVVISIKPITHTLKFAVRMASYSSITLPTPSPPLFFKLVLLAFPIPRILNLLLMLADRPECAVTGL